MFDAGCSLFVVRGVFLVWLRLVVVVRWGMYSVCGVRRVLLVVAWLPIVVCCVLCIACWV